MCSERMKKLLLSQQLLVLLAILFAQNTPNEALKTFEIPDRYELRIIAVEPEIVELIVAAWDEDH